MQTNTWNRIGLVLLLFVGFFFSAGQAQAVSVGISPATLTTVMQSGVVGDFTFTVSRSETDTDFTFTVDTKESDLVYLSQGNEFTLERGMQRIDIPFSVDTGSLEMGEYAASFLVQQKELEDSAATLNIRFGVQAEFDLTVVDEQTYRDLLRQDVVSIKGNYFDSPSYPQGTTMILSNEVRNMSDVFANDLTLTVEVLKENGEPVATALAESLQLKPIGNKSYKTEIVAPEPGEYTVRSTVRSGDDVLDVSEAQVTVTEPVAASGSGTVLWIIGIAIIVIGLLVATRRKRK